MKIISSKMVNAGLKSIKESLSKNSPKILAGLGIAFGTGSVLFAVKGTVRAVEIVEEQKVASGKEELEKTEIVKAVWKEYVPTVALGAASVLCVIGSVHVSTRRLAVMAAAYAIRDEDLKKYKEKTKELVGEKKEEQIRGEIMQEYIDANPPSKNCVVRNTSGGTTLCLDKLTGQYFYSDADTIRRAINSVNNLLLHDYTVSLNDLYIEIGIEQCKVGDDFGWNIIDGEIIEPDFTTEMDTCSDQPVLVLDYVIPPYPNYNRAL